MKRVLSIAILFIGLVMTINYCSFSGMTPISEQGLLDKAAQGRLEQVVMEGENLRAQERGADGVVREYQAVIPKERAPKLVSNLQGHSVVVVEVTAPWEKWWFSVLCALLTVMVGVQVRNFVRSAFAATFLVIVFFWCHQLAFMPPETAGFFTLGALRYKLFLSGPIPFAILWTTLACLHFLFQIFNSRLMPLMLARIPDLKAMLALQKRHQDGLKSQQQEKKKEPEKPQAPEHNKEGDVEKEEEDALGGFISERLKRLERRYQRDGDLGAVIALKNDLLEQDEEGFALAFTSVRWCEVALPLLGFLGTVVGIGEAMGGVSQGVQRLFRGLPMSDALGYLNQGFSGMAVAFDTTFLGLAALITVGIPHMALRKGLATGLSYARQALTMAVETWTGASPEHLVTSALGGVQACVVSLQNTVLHQLAGVADNQKRASDFRETVQQMALQVVREDPHLKSVRDALLVPIVEFQPVGLDLVNKTTKCLREALGDKWDLHALGISLKPGGGAIIAASKGQTEWLLPITIVGPRQNRPSGFAKKVHDLISLGSMTETVVLSLTPVDRESHETTTGAVCRVKSTPDGLIHPATLLDDHGTDTLLPLLIGNRPFVLILHEGDKKKGAFVWSGDLFEKAGRLPDQWQWTAKTTHPPSGHLFAFGKSPDGRNSLLIVLTIERQEVSKAKAEAPKPSPPQPKAYRIRFAKQSHYVELPSAFAVSQLVAVASDALVIVDERGRFYYWDSKISQPSLLQITKRVDSEGTTWVQPGRRGWIAVAQDGTLSMWRIHRGGFAERYDHPGLSLGDVRPDSLRASLDGAYLFGIGKDRIYAWEFPRLAMDELLGTAL